ncbi:MAG TPA: MFS transporter [Bacteroidota bacterium]|nr:MFS transporter [Bacteroidota bacterium]
MRIHAAMRGISLRSLLERLGLHRPELRAWAMYDWANSAFILVIVTAVFPIYFREVAAKNLTAEHATTQYGWATTVALTVAALLSPILGALADFRAARKRMLAVFLLLGVAATGCMYLLGEGDWQPALGLFIVGNVGLTLTFVFYDSLLPHIASSAEIDRVSAAGYALGYLGSGLLLMLNLAWIQYPSTFGIADSETATRLSFLSVALWWALFSLPLFRRVSEPPRRLEADESATAGAIRVTFRRLLETVHELRGLYSQAFLMLVAMLVYNDGIGTIIRMAAVYATDIGIPRQHIILAILLVQFVGIPFSFLFGTVATRIGAKWSIMIGLAVYGATSIVAYSMTSVEEFYLLAMLVASVQGGTQALSRSLFASMIPKHKTSEMFGFFSVFDKVSGILGPFLFSTALVATGSTRSAILSVIVFFIVGAVLLFFVNVEKGRREAERAEALLLSGASGHSRRQP